jgi:peptidoglycan/LPS O-acetylase OafA/YrhL
MAPERPAQRPEIDGLRAIAILPVVLFHAGLGCPGGFVGVDIFFVISGFLITGIILRELDAGAFSLSRFWLRRIRRLFPALIVFFAATLLVGWKVLFPTQFASLASQMISALGVMANFKMRQMLGWYWAPKADTIPLLHTWSLAVEEQFYFFMPFLLIAAHRWMRRWIGGVVLLVLIASLTLCWHFGRTDPGFNFYLLPTRAWELLIGCLGACVVRRGLALPGPLAVLAGGIGLWMILFSVFYSGGVRGWPNAWTLVPTLGTVLILVSPEPEGQRNLTARLLSIPPLRFIGLISYSLYLWHWPIVVFLSDYKSQQQITSLDRWLVVAISIVAAAASWRFVEQPFRNGSRSLRIGARPFLIGAVAAWMFVMAACLWARETNGFEKLFLANLPPHAGRVIFPPPDSESNKDYNANQFLSAGGVRFGGVNGDPRCVVLGDSHGTALGPVVEALSQTYNLPCAMFAQSGTPGFFAGTNTFVVVYGSDNAEKRRQDEIVKRYIAQWKPGLVIIAGRWMWQMISCWGLGRAASTAAMEQACRDTTAWLTERGAKVVILTQSPILPINDVPDNGPEIWKFLRTNGNVLPKFSEAPDTLELRQTTTALLRRAATPQATVLDISPPFQNPDGSIRYYNDDGPLYRDNHHLNRLGVLELRPLLEPCFQALASNHTDAHK